MPAIKQRLAFSLIEVLTVIVIIGILFSLGGYVYASALQRSRDGQRLSDLKLIKSALEQYYLDNRQYPAFDHPNNAWVMAARWQLGNEFDNTLRCAHSPNTHQLAPNYMTSIPEDPRHKLNPNGDCTTITAKSQDGQYLYFSWPDSKDKGGNGAQSPAIGFYLLAKLEGNNQQIDPSPLFGPNSYYRPGINGLSFGLGTQASQNYYLANGRNN